MKSKDMTKKLTLCGIFAALCIVFLYIGGFTVADLSLLVVCAIMTMVILVETGEKYAWVYVGVTSTLALILLPSKLYALEYIMLSAVYPILKMHFERMRNLAGDEFFSLSVVTVAVGTVFFVLYDFCLSACITLYMVKLRKKFTKTKR